MTERPGAAGPRRACGPPPRIRAWVVLSLAAAVLAAGAPARAAVPRQRPEEKLLSTSSQPQVVAFVYTPRPPATLRPALPPVVLFSGEFGWVPLLQDAASVIAATGRVVVGIDSTEYFSTYVSGNDRASDLAKFRALANERAGRPKDGDLILAGFLYGASTIPYILNEPGVTGVRGAVLLSPRGKGVKVFGVGVQLRMDPPPDELIDVEKEIRRMAPLPLVFMEGKLDTESAAKTLDAAARGPHKLVEVEGGDKQFHDVRDGLFAVLGDALQWIDGAKGVSAPPSATPPRAAPSPTPAPQATPSRP